MQQTEQDRLSLEDRKALEVRIKELVDYIQKATDTGVELYRYSPHIKELRRLRRMRI